MNIISGTFQSSTPAQFINAKYASMNVQGNTFEQTAGLDLTSSPDLRDGSAIWIDSTVRINADSNIFRNMITLNGAVTIAENEAAIAIEVLYQAQAANGDKLVSFSNNNFINCNSHGLNGGGGIYFGCSIDGCQLYFNSDHFENCSSANVGGAIAWIYDEPIDIGTTTFTNNNAVLYGDDISAVAEQLLTVSEEFYNANIISTRRSLIDDDDPYPTNTVSSQMSGGELPTFYIGIFDKYGNLVKSENDALLRPEIVNPISVTVANSTYEPFITETASITSINGLFKASGISMTGFPTSTQTIKFTTSVIDDTLPPNAAYLIANNLSDSGITMKINLRECELGEAFLDSGECEACEAGVGYLLTAAAVETSCIPCPVAYATCIGGSSIVPKAGYWRPSNVTDVFYECNNVDACLGYIDTTSSLQGDCLEGYDGILCGKCKIGYTHVGDYECGQCPDEVLNTIRVILFFVLVTFIVGILVVFTIRGANNKRNILGVYNRVLVNHMQMLVIIYSFDLQWPDEFINIFGSTETVAEAPQQFMSFDCFIDERSENDPDSKNSMRLYYWRVIIAAVVPFLIVGLNYALWNFIYLFYSKQGEVSPELTRVEYLKNLSATKTRRIHASVLIVLIFFHPSLIDVLFEMFNCVDIDGDIRMSRELDEICYEGTHLYLVVFVVIPSILLWGFGLPTISLIALIHKREKRNTLEVREELGYLYNGFLNHAFYWESIIMYRKFIMVMLSTAFSLAGRKVQSMLVFGLMIFIICLHSLIKPFMTPSLNNLETMSILALTLTIFAGIFFVTDSSNNPTTVRTRNEFELNDTEKIILFMMFVLSNLLFFLWWGMLYAMEARRFMRVKYPSAFHYLCLCGNPNAVEREKQQREGFIRSDKYIDSYMEIKDDILIIDKQIRNTTYKKTESAISSLKDITKKISDLRKHHKSLKEIGTANLSTNKIDARATARNVSISCINNILGAES
jgi:hypothetical protein